MGLRLTAVSPKYHYNKEGEEIGEEYLSTDIGYISYKILRDDLQEFFSTPKYGGPVYKYLEYSVFYNSETFEVAIEASKAEDGDLENENFAQYLNELQVIKAKNPSMYSLLPFLCHNDSEGEIPYEQVELFLPLIKVFAAANPDNHYGYSGWDYNFMEDFIKILEIVVDKKGKLWYS